MFTIIFIYYFLIALFVLLLKEKYTFEEKVINNMKHVYNFLFFYY